MIEVITTEWKTKREILSELHMPRAERKLRLEIERNNDLWCKGLSDDYIAHSSRGYKRAQTDEEVRISLLDLTSRANNINRKVAQLQTAIQNKNQVSI